MVTHVDGNISEVGAQVTHASHIEIIGIIWRKIIFTMFLIEISLHHTVVDHLFSHVNLLVDLFITKNDGVVHLL